MTERQEQSMPLEQSATGQHLPEARLWKTDRQAATSLVDRTFKSFGADEEDVWQNYALVTALERVSKAFVRGQDGDVALLVDGDGAVNRKKYKNMSTAKRESVAHVGTLLFAGGTSLSSAWEISPRLSVDIDLVMVGLDGKPVLPEYRELLGKAVLNEAKLGSGVAGNPIVSRHGIMCFGVLNQLNVRVKIDVVVDKSAELLPTENRMVNSLIRYACPEPAVRDKPEFGGFELPCTRPEITAANKLSALHNMSLTRAATEFRDFRALERRIRYLLDLYYIAQDTGRVAVVNSLLEEHDRLLADSGRPELKLRPAGGYSNAAVFNHGHIPTSRQQGTPAYQALCAAHDKNLDGLIYKNWPWGELAGEPVAAPTAEECVAAALTLDQAA